MGRISCPVWLPVPAGRHGLSGTLAFFQSLGEDPFLRSTEYGRPRPLRGLEGKKERITLDCLGPFYHFYSVRGVDSLSNPALVAVIDVSLESLSAHSTSTSNSPSTPLLVLRCLCYFSHIIYINHLLADSRAITLSE